MKRPENTAEPIQPVVWITGAASGIGLALTRHYLGIGSIVFATDIAPIPAELGSEPNCLFRITDVTDRIEVETAFASLLEAHQQVDLVINCAGWLSAGAFEDITPEVWARTLNVNLNGTFNVCHTAYRQMLKQQSGHIVNVASMYGFISSPASITYVTTKHAVVGMSDSLYLEARVHNIAVTTVCPGFIKTPLFDNGSYVGIDSRSLLSHIPFPWMTSEQAVKKITNAIRRKKRFSIFPAYVHLYRFASWIAPGLVNRLAASFAKKIRSAS